MSDFNVSAVVHSPLTYVATTIIAGLFYLGAAVSENNRKLDLVLAEVRENGRRIEENGRRITVLEARVGGLETRVGGLDTRVAVLEERIVRLHPEVGSR